MSERALARHLGFTAGRLEETYPGMAVVNHQWWDPETFADLGTIPASRLEAVRGRLSMDVPVLLNRAVVEHDVALVVGPVLPHEVVGMSGGNKYFFPGVAGQAIIDVSHWLGALITSAEIIGTTGITPVRALINEGAALVPAQSSPCVVGASGSLDLHSVSFGDTLAAWADAAEVCAATHVTYLDEPVGRVISIIPQMYEDIWTGAKGFYKLEPAVADGGEVILYAPHISEISSSHGDQRDRLPLPRLLREAVGPLPARPLGGAGALHAPARGRHLRRAQERSASGSRTLATRIPRRSATRPTWATSTRSRSTWPWRRPTGHAGGAECRGGPVPVALSRRPTHHEPRGHDHAALVTPGHRLPCDDRI